MPSPFDKTFAPDADIDLSLFSHIHNDPFLAGTFSLEGNHFKRTAGYLDRYCKLLAADKPLPREILALQARMNKLVDVEAEIVRIKQMAAGDKLGAEKALNTLVEGLGSNLLNKLKMGEYLSLPGGWDTNGPGHAMVYQFKRTASGFEFYIHNAGAGIEYHERRSATDREQYYPVQAYHIPMPVNVKKLNGFLRDLMLSRIKSLREDKDQAFDAQRLYESVLPRINFLNARLIPVEGSADHAFTAGQLSGTCSQRALHQMLKQNFRTLEEYQRFIYQFKRYALDDYIAVLRGNGQIGDRRVQILIRRAINTMVRTLNIPGVFAEEFITKERRELLASRELLAQARANSIVPAVPPVVPSVPKTTVTLGAVAATLRPVIQQPAIVHAVVISPGNVVSGGIGLLEQLRAFSLDCVDLKTKGQHPIIIERLESLFASFPLPASMDKFDLPLEFYREINGRNEDDFYALIESLQTAYLDACNVQSGDAPLPRKLITGLSIISVIDYVTNQLKRNKAGTPSNHDALGILMRRFFDGSRNNPFFATNHPVLDARLKSIQSLYPDDSVHIKLIEYYAGIIDSEPEIKAKLAARFVPPANAQMARLLRESRYEALYCLLETFTTLSTQPEFLPLIKKFNTQRVVERCVLRGMQPVWGNGAALDQKMVVEEGFFGTLDVKSVLNNTMWNNHERSFLKKHKYGLAENLASERALAIDYADAGARGGAKARSDNHTQLYPSEFAKVRVPDIKSDKKSILSGRQIDRREIADREFFHLRSSVHNQVKLTLDYFLQHLSKLSDRACQIYMEANLLEPGLLAAELDKDPAFLDKIDHFVDEGLKEFSERGCTSQSSLFFIRLAYLVNHYAAQYKPTIAYARLDKLQQRLTSLLQIDEKNDVSIKQTLHQYQFLTAMARLKLRPGVVGTAEKEAILSQALPSYFYMNANHNPQAFVDTASRFDLECVKHDFKLLVPFVDQRQVGRLAGSALEKLGLGVLVGEPTKPGALYHVTMKKDGLETVYRVDAIRGLVFNDKGMAFSPVPLDILTHPVMSFLDVKRLDPCFTSSDGLCIELGEPKLRFIRRKSDAKFRVQKEWTVNGRTVWYELNTLSDEQGAVFKLESWSYGYLDIPAIIKERNNQIWIGCEENKSFVITENNRPIYTYSESRTQQQIKQLDTAGRETAFNLCLGTTWLHRQFAKFEDAAFITVCNHADEYQVNFGRYGFTLLVSKRAGQWVYRLQNEPSYTLVGDVNTLIAGVAGLVFEDKRSAQRICYLPIQQFTVKKELSERSEFYNLQQDTTARIPTHIEKKLADKGLTSGPMPWQYSGSERILRYQLDTEGKLRPETPCDALYLCYMLLGSQQPEKAWDVLEDCAKRLGGLKGTVEELELLNWIINSLPKTLDDSDSKAVISTPPYVACQLKALALLTGAFTPDKVILFPPKTFDLKTPDGRYQDKCWKELKGFHAGLNGIIYSTYSRFQSMQRHMEHGFVLKDSEKKSLLDYYHFNLPGDEPKALGALGYEWHVLGLKALRKEFEALKAEEAAKGGLPAGYQKRLAEIDAFLRKEMNVRKHHSELVLRSIDTSIPASLSTFEIDNSLYWRLHHFKDDMSTCPAASDEDLQAALTPDITEGQLFLYFPHYYNLLLKTHPVGRERDHQNALVDFCRQYLIAHRFTPLDKQGNKVAYLCNVLYRISQSPRIVSGWGEKGLFNIIYRAAERLPDPDIKIYQVFDTTDKVLAKTSDVWAALDREVPAPSKPMLTAPYSPAVDYSAEKLIDACGFDVEVRRRLQQFGEQYRAAAKIFGQPPAEAAPDVTELMVLSPSEREAGQEQVHALQTMKQVAGEMLADPAIRGKLQAKAQVFIDDIDRERQQQLGVILDLANIGPAHPIQKRHRDLEIEGEARARLDEKQLLALYYGADKARYVLETGLTDAQIQELHTKISHYLVLSIRQQSLQRLHNKLVSVALPLDPSVLHQVAHELLTIDRVDHKAEPALAILQYNHNLLLRPQQISAIKDLLTTPATDPFSYKEEIKKIIMGGGKSKEVLPGVAKKKATGTNLVVIEVPRALFETNCADLSYTSGLLFNQKAYPFEFNRDSDCSPEGLEFIYSKLIDVIVGKDYLVTTGDAIQSLELKYLELVLQPPEDIEQRKRWAHQVECLDKIVSLFRTRADVVMDEVHQALLLKKKLNYTLGDRRAVSTSIITECVELYRFFDQVALDKLGADFAGKSLASILENHKLMMELMPESSHWAAAMERLTYELLNHAQSPLRQHIQRLRLRAGEKDELINYLSNKGERIPDCILRCEDPKIRTIFALYKEQASELLSQTLKRKLNVNYGASHQRPGEGLAIPYETNNKPLERSRFGNFLEAIDFSIQMLLIGGAEPELLRRYLNQLQMLARQELLKDPTYGTLDNTDTAKGLQAVASGLGLTLSQIRLDDDVQFQYVFNKLRHNKALLCEILKTDVLPQIHVESQILHSDAYNHVDIYRSAQGVTGTPSNSTTYHQRLAYNKKTAAATDGFILGLLESKGTAIRPVAHANTPQELLERLFTGKVASESVRAIIDICALFRGISNLEVATALAGYARLHPDIFAVPSPLQYIMFFNADNRLCALGIGEGSTPIVIGSTDPDVINAKLGCTPDARFNYYDQEHTLGVDLKLPRRAKGLALVDRETTLEKAFQGFLREREFQDDQQIEIIVPMSMSGISLSQLIDLFAENEEQQLQQDNFSAAQAKMTNVIRADFMKRLLALPSHAVEEKYRYATAFKDYFVQQANNDFFGLYGGLAVTRPAKLILEEQRDRMLRDWSETLKGLREDVGAAAPETMRKNLNDIITHALPLCQKEYLSPTRQEHGKEVEVQKQVQVELQRETQLVREVFNPALEPQPYQRWWDSELGPHPYRSDRGFLSLTNLCRRNVPTAPDFGEVYVGSNYYQSYTGQTQFLGAFLKPVHALLFRQRVDGKLDCLILSQQEAEELTISLERSPKPNIWISTTQHTVLAGRAPATIKEDVTYQALIEKVRFFNGEHNLLLSGDMPLNWLSEESGKKLSFFEQNLLQYRETEHKEMLTLKQALSQRQRAFRYIAEHPLENYKSFEWRVHVSEDLTDADIEECEKLAAAFSYANAHWRDKGFTREKCVEGHRLSLQASAHIYRYFDEQLFVLRGLFPLYEAGHADDMRAVVDSILPTLIKDKEFIPGVRSKQQLLLEFLLKKASIELHRESLIRVADWLVVKGGARIDEVNVAGENALELVLQGAGDYVLEPVRWLLAQGARPAIQQKIWPKVTPQTLDQLVQLPVFFANEQFLVAYVVAFKDNEEKLTEIVKHTGSSQPVLRKIIEVITNPTQSFLAILLTNNHVRTDAVLVSQLLDRVVGDVREWLLAQLVAITNLSSEVVGAIIEKSQPAPVEFYIKIFESNHSKLQAEHLAAIAGALPRDTVGVSNASLLSLMNNVLSHPAVNSNVLEAVARYALQLDMRLMKNFWTNFLSVYPWNLFAATTLREMVLTFSDELVSALLQTRSFQRDKDSIISKLLEGADPVLYQKLLKNSALKLEPRHFTALLTTIDAKVLQPILPQIAAHPITDAPALSMVIAAMVEPAEELIHALLANSLFTSDPQLVTQCLEKVTLATRKQMLSALASNSTIAPSVISVVISKNNPSDLAICQLVIEYHGTRLDVRQLKVMLNILIQQHESTVSVMDATLLLSKMVLLPAMLDVLDLVVSYTLLFKTKDIESFWRDQISLLPWDNLPSGILSRMFLQLPQHIIDVLFESQTFKTKQKHIIDKLIESANPVVYRNLLQNERVSMRSNQLLMLMANLDGEQQVQTLLPLIVVQPGTDQDVLKKVIELMKEPASELLDVLLVSELFTSSDALIQQLLDKVKPTTRSKIVAKLSSLSKSKTESDVLIILIREGKEEGQTEARRFMALINKHGTDLGVFHFITMLEVLSAQVVKPQLPGEIIELLCRIVRDVHATPAVQQAAVLYALQLSRSMALGIKSMDVFWRELSTMWWEEFDAHTLCEMFLNLSAEIIDSLLRSGAFTDDPERLINKFIQSHDDGAYRALLNLRQIKLKSKHLIALIMARDIGDIQPLLPIIAVHPAADLTVLKNVIEVMVLPAPELISVLLSNQQLIADVGLVHQLWLIFAPTADQKVPRKEAMQLLQQVLKASWTAVDTSVLESAVLYILQFDPQNLIKFWGEISSFRWDRFDISTIRTMLLTLSATLIDELFVLSPTFTANKEDFINKLILVNDIDVYRVSLQSKNMGLLANHLMQILDHLDTAGMQQLLPQIAKHPAVDRVVLQKIILLMPVPPAEELMRVLLSNDIFKTDAPLLLQLLERVGLERSQWMITELTSKPGLSAEVLAVVIDKNSPFNFEGYRNMLVNYSGKLREGHLNAMVTAIASPENAEAVPPVTLMQEIVKHPRTVKSVLTKMIAYAIKFEPLSMEAFWQDISLMKWDQLDAEILQPMFIALNGGILDLFLDSLTYIRKKETVIWTVTQAPNVEIYSLLLTNVKAKLRAEHLDMFVTTLDRMQVQAILPLIAQHRAADQSICNAVMELMDAPTVELLQALLANEQCRITVELIDRFAKCGEPGVYRLLMKSDRVKLQTRHLLGFISTLDPHVVQSILPDIAGHADTDDEILQAVIEVMQEPTDELFTVLLASLRFVTNAALVRQLLEKIDQDNGQQFISRLARVPEVGPDVLTVIIEKNDPLNLRTYSSIFDTHDAKLGDEHLDAIARAVSSPAPEAVPREEAIKLMQRLVAHEESGLAIKTIAVKYVLQFGEAYTIDFWSELSGQRWDKIDAETLGQMFLKLPGQIDTFIRSRAFVAHRESVINKLIQSGNHFIYRLLLDRPQVDLESEHLLSFLTAADLGDEHVLLEKIAGHKEADLPVMQKIIEVMREPTDALLKLLLTHRLFFTDGALVRALLLKIEGHQRDWVLTELRTNLEISAEVAQVILEENKFDVHALAAIYEAHRINLNQEQLIAMLPTDELQINAWRGQQRSAAKLLKAILQHTQAETKVMKAVMDCALAVIPPEARFWKEIPQKVDKVDLSGNKLGNKLDEDLKKIFESLSEAAEVDLSNNNLGKKDKEQLAEILATLPPNVRRLNLTGNHIERTDMPFILAAIPQSVATIAYERNRYMPRAEVTAQFTDHSFLFNCFAAVALVAGAALLIVGLVALNPIFIGVGAGVVATVIGGALLAKHGMFSSKPPFNGDNPEEEPLLGPRAAAG